MQPLLGDWVSEPAPGAKHPAANARCTRSFRTFGKGWIELDMRWDLGAQGIYREIALFGATAGGGIGFDSFTIDGKRSAGTLSDGSDVHPQAIAFEARMPAGLARMIYWPLEHGPGFHYAVESSTAKGWKRFLSQTYCAA
jgi:hypothetical protein